MRTQFGMRPWRGVFAIAATVSTLAFAAVNCPNNFCEMYSCYYTSPSGTCFSYGTCADNNNNLHPKSWSTQTDDANAGMQFTNPAENTTFWYATCTANCIAPAGVSKATAAGCTRTIQQSDQLCTYCMP